MVQQVLQVGIYLEIHDLQLMEEILHHLGCIKPNGYWDIYYINWCRISSINSTSNIFQTAVCFFVWSTSTPWKALLKRTRWRLRDHPILCSSHLDLKWYSWVMNVDGSVGSGGVTGWGWCTVIFPIIYRVWYTSGHKVLGDFNQKLSISSGTSPGSEVCI